MPAVRRNALIEWLWRLHRWLYRRSGGRIGGRIGPWPILLLTTTGRKTGRAHTVALQYLSQGDAGVLIASNAGEPRHPAWYLNLKAQPEGIVERQRHRVFVVAREAEGEERERLWERIVEIDRAYAVYQERTSRRIPVVVLEPRSLADRGSTSRVGITAAKDGGDG
jgi:deazaflavin-dependent oxidoreductase (nitroreductase family)